MHRREIDHPEYVPADVRSKLDFESGKTSGRIYRIVRDQPAPAAAAPAAPPTPTVAELVRDLESPDGWTRELAQARLVERGDPAAEPLLEKSAAEAPLPASRVRALWTLHGLKRLSTTAVRAALSDAHAGVREQGVILAGGMLAAQPDLLPGLLAMAGDPDPRVRFQCALALGSVDDARAVPALAAIIVRDGQDRWTRAAVLSGIGTRMAAFFDAVRAAPDPDPQAYAAATEDLGRVFGAGAPLEDCRAFLTRTLTDNGELDERLSSILGLGDGLRGRSDLDIKGATNPFVALLGPTAPPATARALDDFFRVAAALVADDQATAAQKTRAVALLGYTDFDQAGAALGSLLGARHSPQLQLQAVKALERFGDPRAGELLIQPEKWAHYTPQIREAVIAALISKPQMTATLFTAIERKVIKPAEVAPMQRNRLLKHKNAAIREGAETAFHELQGGDRMQVYEQYRDALQLPADPARGASVFTQTCSACHTFNGVGGHVGPDLSGIRNQPADALLLHILVPNYEVVPGFQAVSITLRDGSTVVGHISTETESSVTLRTVYGTDETVLRTHISSLVASGLSLMPDGLEQSMTKNELADLIAYLKSIPPDRI
jgi:putative heme-binding domain-containing protein